MSQDLARRVAALTALAGSMTLAASCAALQQIAALRQVDFDIDRVAAARLAGVDVQRLTSYEQLGPLDVARVGAAIARGELPFEFDLHLSALNPPDNNVAARLIQMDWTLLLEDRETISGRVDREIVMQPGVPHDIAIPIRLDLIDFFDTNARDLVDLALSVAGAGGSPRRVSLRAVPTIQTSLGPIRYPQPIVIVSRQVGGTWPPR
jgi:hypothetical protein